MPVAGFFDADGFDEDGPGLLEFADGFVELLLLGVLVLVELELPAFGCSTAGAVIGTITSNVDNNSPNTESEATSLLLSTLLVTLTPQLRVSRHL